MHWARTLHRLAYAEARVKGEAADVFRSKWKTMDYVANGPLDRLAEVVYTGSLSTEKLITEVAPDQLSPVISNHVQHITPPF